MEIDGKGERKIKRNMPLGVTGERARVRGMRGLQARQPHMGLKKKLARRRIKYNCARLSSAPLLPSSFPLQPSPRGRGDQFSSSLPTPPGVCFCWW